MYAVAVPYSDVHQVFKRARRLGRLGNPRVRGIFVHRVLVYAIRKDEHRGFASHLLWTGQRVPSMTAKGQATLMLLTVLLFDIIMQLRSISFPPAQPTPGEEELQLWARRANRPGRTDRDLRCRPLMMTTSHRLRSPRHLPHRPCRCWVGPQRHLRQGLGDRFALFRLRLARRC